jgi:hypothetical protein
MVPRAFSHGSTVFAVFGVGAFVERV